MKKSFVYDQCVFCGLPYSRQSEGCRQHRDVLFAVGLGEIELSRDEGLMLPPADRYEPVAEGEGNKRRGVMTESQVNVVMLAAILRAERRIDAAERYMDGETSRKRKELRGFENLVELMGKDVVGMVMEELHGVMKEMGI